MNTAGQTATEIANDIRDNTEWFSDTVYHVVAGNYDYSDYALVQEYYSEEAPRLGRRRFNLIARVGQLVMEREYNTDQSKALKVWHLLGRDAQQQFDDIVRKNIIRSMED